MSEKEYKNIDDFKQSEYYKRANDPKTRETIDSEIDDKFRQAGNGIGNLIHNVKILYQMICDKNFKIPNDKLVLIIAGLFYFVSPFDIVPDFFPFIGFVDDAAVIAMIVSAVLSLINQYIKSKDSHDI